MFFDKLNKNVDIAAKKSRYVTPVPNLALADIIEKIFNSIREKTKLCYSILNQYDVNRFPS